MESIIIALLLAASQPSAIRHGVDAARHFVMWASMVRLSVRRGRLAIDDAIRLLHAATAAALLLIGYAAFGDWHDGTAAGRLVFAVIIGTGVYVFMGTRGTIDLLQERKRWLSARRLIND